MKRSTWVAAVVVGLAGALGGCSNLGDTCQPGGEAVVRSTPIGALAVDEETVYWTAKPAPGEPQRGEVWRKAKSGGEPERLYQSAEEPIFPFPRLSVDATHVYWLEMCSRPGITPPCAEVRRVPKAGGTVQTLVRDRVYMFAVDGDVLYYSTSNEQQPGLSTAAPSTDGAVWSRPKDGSGSPVALVSNLTRLRDVQVTATHVYFVADRGTPPGIVGREVWISRVPKTGGAVETAALADFAPDAFVLLEQGLLYLQDRAFYRAPLGDTMPELLTIYFDNDVAGLAVAGDTVYFGDAGKGVSGGGLDGEGSRYLCGAIRSMPLSGGESKPFAKDQVRPRSLLTDGAMLYWISGESDSSFVTIRRARL